MSSGFVGTLPKVVQIQLDARIGSPKVTCIDITESGHRKARFLEMSTLVIHKVPLTQARTATEIGYDPAHMASFLYRQMRMYEASNTVYDAEVVQRVAKQFVDVTNAPVPVERSVRSSRRIVTD